MFHSHCHSFPIPSGLQFIRSVPHPFRLTQHTIVITLFKPLSSRQAYTPQHCLTTLPLPLHYSKDAPPLPPIPFLVQSSCCAVIIPLRFTVCTVSHYLTARHRFLSMSHSLTVRHFHHRAHVPLGLALWLGHHEDVLAPQQARFRHILHGQGKRP